MTEVRMPKRQTHTLIFEPLCGGHRGEFIDHLLDYILAGSCDDRKYTFVVDSAPFGFHGMPNVCFEEISEKDKAALAKGNAWLGSFVFFRVLNRYLNAHKPDCLVIMDLTDIELALCFKRLPCRTSALLFVQYPELRSVVSMKLKHRLKFKLKEVKTGFLLRQPKLEKVFLLNGQSSCNYLNSHFHTNLFQPLPDPVPCIHAEAGFSIRQQYGLEKERRIFLFFGSMSVRKGVEQLVDALKDLSQHAAQESAFLFCGRPEDGYENHYRKLIENLQNQRPDICICVEQEFVSGERMRALFEQSDWILLPYNRPEYSSGILGHAAASKTPIIGSSDGLIGRQIREYKLGIDASKEPNVLCTAIEGALDSGFVFDETNRTAFVDAGSPRQFAARLLKESLHALGGEAKA